MSKDYYKILGIDRNATKDDIKKAYRKIAMKYHPDRNSEDPDSESKFKDATEAYDVLFDDNKKRNYDTFGTADGGFNSGQGFGYSMNDIFSQFGDVFSDFFNRKSQNKGNDLRVSINVTIEDVINGASKKIKYNRKCKCSGCSGTGGTDTRTCRSCNGSGHRVVVQNTPFSQIRRQIICNDCNGTGTEILNKCKVCNGEGTEIKSETVEVDIPPGVSDNMIYTIDGMGNYIKNGINGDLQILISEIKEYYFKRVKDDIIIDKEVSVIDAIIGTNLDVKTPHGIINISVPAGTNHDDKIKLREKGIKNINSTKKGDMYIIFKLKIPKKINLEEKLILEKLKKSKNFN